MTLERRPLEASGIKPETPVTFAAKNVSLRSALNLILKPLELTWMIQHEMLVITTPEEAETELNVRIYEVSDLIVLPPPKPALFVDGLSDVPDFIPLIELIYGTVTPDSWSDGNSNDVQELAYDGRNVLVIRQTDRIHFQIGRLLESLRAAKRPQGNESDEHRSKKADATEFVVQVYPIDKNYRCDPKELEELVRLAVGSDQWKDETTFARALAGTVIVKHNRSVQQTVYALLSGIGAYRSPWQFPSTQSNGGGFGSGSPKSQ